MKLAVSNIAWAMEHDETMYTYLHAIGFAGIEIAPTRLWPMPPYEKKEEAHQWAKNLREHYGLMVPSLQSIWYQRNENMFADETKRQTLLAYTKEAIGFAKAVGAHNLVFGCPKNRNRDPGCPLTKEQCLQTAEEFFRELGEYAAAHQTAIGIEPNPPIYHTNFINETGEAFALVRKVASKGCKVNIDVGTILQNGEDLDILWENMPYVSHIHISEPGLQEIEKRQIHQELARILTGTGYAGYVSIEMKNLENIKKVQEICAYVRHVFAA